MILLQIWLICGFLNLGVLHYAFRKDGKTMGFWGSAGCVLLGSYGLGSMIAMVLDQIEAL